MFVCFLDLAMYFLTQDVGKSVRKNAISILKKISNIDGDPSRIIELCVQLSQIYLGGDADIHEDIRMTLLVA